ncbi:hypothetical protein [Streptomyces sp. NBC_01334]|nr:hypothetical protein OG736_37675 [Streptomyces sp. NBC_01334]
MTARHEELAQAKHVVTVAESEAQTVRETILTALREASHFKLEAGAGAGKTSSLIEALQSILADRDR